MMSRAHGIKAWLIQRLSAVFMVAYLVFVAGCLMVQIPQDYAQWHAFMSAPLMSVGTLMFALLLLMHAWVGIRDVVMDYVQTDGLRFSLLIVLGGTLFAMGIWVLRIMVGAG